MSTERSATTKSSPINRASVQDKLRPQRRSRSIRTRQQTKMDMAKDSDSIQLDRDLEEPQPLTNSNVEVETAELFSPRHTEADETSASSSHTVTSVSAALGSDIVVDELTISGSSTTGNIDVSYF